MPLFHPQSPSLHLQVSAAANSTAVAASVFSTVNANVYAIAAATAAAVTCLCRPL
jgi:hypothetical protein